MIMSYKDGFCEQGRRSSSKRLQGGMTLSLYAMENPPEATYVSPVTVRTLTQVRNTEGDPCRSPLKIWQMPVTGAQDVVLNILALFLHTVLVRLRPGVGRGLFIMLNPHPALDSYKQPRKLTVHNPLFPSA